MLALLLEQELTEAADPRAVPQSHLPERRRLRRRDDVAQPVRQAGEHAHARRRRRSSPGSIRAPSALSPWSNLDGAHRAQPRRPAADARGRVHHRGAGAGGARSARPRIRPYPGADGSALAATRRNSCGSSSAIGSAATIRPTGRSGRRSCPDLQDAAERAVDRRPAPVRRSEPAGGAGRDRSGDRRHPRDGRRPRLPRVAVQPRVAQPASAGLGVQAVPLCRGAVDAATRRSACSRACRRSRRKGPTSGRRATPAARTPTSLTLRAALIESNNRAATLLQQRIGSRPVLRLASDVGLRDLPDVPSLSLGTGLVTPLDLTAAFAMFPNGGSAVQPRGLTRVIDAGRRRRLRQSRARGPRDLGAGRLSRWCRCSRTSSTAAPAARRAPRYGVRFPVGGKTGTTDDFKDAWFVGFTLLGRRRRLGRARSAGDDRRATATARATRCRSGATSCAPPRGSVAAREFEPPDGMREEPLCKVSYLQAGRGLPDLHGVLQGRGSRSRRACARSTRAREAADPARGSKDSSRASAGS